MNMMMMMMMMMMVVVMMVVGELMGQLRGNHSCQFYIDFQVHEIEVG